MYKTCPKCGYTRESDEDYPAGRCPACGLVYRKWFNSRFRTRSVDQDDQHFAVLLPSRQQIMGYLLFSPPGQNIIKLSFYALVLLLLAAWTWQFIGMDYYYYVDGIRVDAATPEIYTSFLHNVNLVFHEAGHVLFTPLGRLMTQLGGSLMQLLVPLVVMLTFLIKERDNFAAAAGLWWLGQNLMDIAPYINDARNMQIPLLGGGSGSDRPGIHDWNNVLSSLGMLESDHSLAAFTNGLGTLIVLLSLAWASTVLVNAYRNRN